MMTMTKKNAFKTFSVLTLALASLAVFGSQAEAHKGRRTQEARAECKKEGVESKDMRKCVHDKLSAGRKEKAAEANDKTQ